MNSLLILSFRPDSSSSRGMRLLCIKSSTSSSIPRTCSGRLDCNFMGKFWALVKNIIVRFCSKKEATSQVVGQPL